ncbi:MAG: tripartite tricarboxylate transporter TctB family protein [Acetobacteraceae bacterium]|nr:MAG: tripartite tricarboxylate transporter TctB family protein [Acetobacteraceae bacterium]
MQLSDRVTGVFLVGLGGLAAWSGSRLPGVPGQDVGPAAFPMLIGSGLIICGAMIALGIGHSFEVPEGPDAEEEAVPGRSRLYGLRVLVPPALLLFYMFASEPLGFLLCGFLMVLAAAFTLGAKPKLAIPLALIAPLFIHLAFYKLLRVPLPEGLIGAPW